MRLKLLYTSFLLMSTFYASAQICNGNKGVNIFTEGDFGSGSNNIYQFNPGIAPGYQYVFNPPVNDGQYCLTNSLVPWTQINGWGWVRIQDDSPDPEGYMLLVNASYDTGLFYQELVTDLCENSLFEFTARIFNVVQAGSNKIKPNVSFLIDGVAVYSTGDIPENEQWNTYGFTFTTAPGQTQVTLALRNNAPGGIGNDLAIDNIKFRACGPRAEILPLQTAFACEDSSDVILDATISGNQYNTPKYQWQRSLDEGASWQNLPGDTFPTYTHTDKSGGAYYYRYFLANSLANLNNSKCRIVSNRKIVRVTPKFTTVRDTICDGLSRTFGLNEFSISGQYTDSLITFFGCDSIVTLDLKVVPDEGIKTNVEVINPKCLGSADGEIYFNSFIDGTAPFRVTVNGNVIPDSFLTDLSPGLYSVNISDRYGCSADTSFIIEDPDQFQLDIGPDLSIDLGDSVEIQTTSNYPIEKYNWSPLIYSNCSRDCESIKILPNKNLTFILNAISGNDCRAGDSVFIEVNEKRAIFIPDVFTPNGDGYNDLFSLQGEFPNVQEVVEFKIFDRWGNTVYSKTNLDIKNTEIAWNGEYQGENVSPGVYYYEYKVRFLDDEILIYTGYLHLFR
ncbi:MAG: gliding motility-associated C-terminal domain-containing protein [Cytophagales bacterium]